MPSHRSPYHVYANRKIKLKQIITVPHAILDRNNQVLAIRDYPRITTSNAVIPIPEGASCKVGWYWNGKEFKP